MPLHDLSYLNTKSKHYYMFRILFGIEKSSTTSAEQDKNYITSDPNAEIHLNFILTDSKFK